MDEISAIQTMDNEVECFGDFNITKAVCRKYCALRLRCAIEKKEQSQIKQLEELIAVQEIPLKLQ
jgi:hypothetical protein